MVCVSKKVCVWTVAEKSMKNWFSSNPFLFHLSWFLLWAAVNKNGNSKIHLPAMLSSIFHSHVDPSLSRCSLHFIISTPWTYPSLAASISNLPHATCTSTVLINTGARSHCATLWPTPCLSEQTGLEACGFSISLSQSPVAQVFDRWALVSGSDPLCCSAHLDSVREHWLWCYSWQGWIRAELMVAGVRQKRPRLWMRCC